MTRALVITLDAASAEAITTVVTECVLDMTGMGDVIGVEILSLARNTGLRAPGSSGMATLGSGQRVGWSYDYEADALYIRIHEERSLDQRCVPCTVSGTMDGRLTHVTVEVDQE